MTLDFATAKNKIYNTKLITSLQEFFDHVDHLDSSWAPGAMWYRGVPKSGYSLILGIYREDTWTYDQVEANDLFHDYIRQGQAYPSQRANISKWEWLHLMQHHGLPTRLLDWTEGALIGLYFALRELPEVLIPSVWVLDPFWLNQESTGSNVVFDTYELVQYSIDETANFYIVDDLDLPHYPIAIRPSYFNPRISAQRACFTVHGTTKKGLEAVIRKSGSPRLAQLRIRTQSAPAMKDDIVRAGIAESTLFPDLEGLAKDLKDRYVLY